MIPACPDDTRLADLAGAVFNFIRPGTRNRQAFISDRFNVPRATLYRKTERFRQAMSTTPGRPQSDGTRERLREIEKRCEDLEAENRRLSSALKKEQAWRESITARLVFMLLTAGLSGRLITWIIKMTLGIRANHTDILRQAKKHAVRATEIMLRHFHPAAVMAAIDEVFIEGLPVFLAVSLRSLTVFKTEVHSERTEERWTLFLNEMKNLEKTFSDRGTAILAAVGKRDGHVHQSDVFHFKHTILKEFLKEEKYCFAKINAEEKARRNLEKRKRRGRDARGKASELRSARAKCERAIEKFDHLEEAVKMAFEALRISDGFFLKDVDTAKEELAFVAEWIGQIKPSWKKVISALRDPNLLVFIDEAYRKIDALEVRMADPLDKERILAALTLLWEEQATRRWRGKPVRIPKIIYGDLKKSCPDLDDVSRKLFKILEETGKSSSAVECVNSRFGFYRYSKKRFDSDYANLISVVHNLTPFRDGKRKGKTPAEIEGIKLPTYDIFELFEID